MKSTLNRAIVGDILGQKLRVLVVDVFDTRSFKGADELFRLWRHEIQLTINNEQLTMKNRAIDPEKSLG